jgi:hypothetical protein
MAIGTNNVGNYNPYAVSNPNRAVKTKAQFPDISITGEEKDFFAEMYPDKKVEINRFSVSYNRPRHPGMHIGQHIDKRG